MQNDVISDDENHRESSRQKSVSPSEFKKHSWMNSFYLIEGEENKSVLCRSCKKQFKNRGYSRLVGHISKCSKASDSEVNLEEMMDKKSSEITKLWTQVVIENNMPLRSIESKNFKKFVANYVPKWKVPTRQELSDIHIPLFSRKLHSEFISEVKQGKLSNLTIEYDHWSDANNRSFLGVIASDIKGSRYLLDLRDVSLKGHYAHIIVEEIVEILSLLPAKSINSIVSDSASSCKKAIEDLIERDNLRHVIQHRCLAHLINNVGSKITEKNEAIAQTVKLASKITGFLSSSSYWSSHIKSLGGKKLKPTCSVRWYSTVNMIQALIQSRSTIFEAILPRLANDKAQLILSLDWDYLTQVRDILTPLNECIGKLEEKQLNLSGAIKVLLNYSRELFEEKPVISEALIYTRVAFLSYFNPRKIGEREFGLFIAAYGFDHRNRFDSITEKGIDLALETVTHIAVRSGFGIQQIKASLIEEFDSYRNFGANYPNSEIDRDPRDWWQSKVDDGILVKVALRIISLRPSSANIERTFSALKYIQGTSRMNLSVQSLVDICRIKIASDVISEDYDQDPVEIPAIYQEASSQPQIRSLVAQTEPWLEDENLETKLSYQSFCDYISFETIYERQTQTSIESQVSVTDEDIRNIIRTARASRVIVDSPSQMANLDFISQGELDQ